MVTTLKQMIPKIKCQCFEQANESLLKKGIYQCLEMNKNEWLLKTNINANNNQINHG